MCQMNTVVTSVVLWTCWAFAVSTAASCADGLELQDYARYIDIDPLYSDLSETQSQYFPYYATASLNQKAMAIESFVIAVHGKNRDADATFCNAVRSAEGLETIAIVAPLFASEALNAQEWGNDGGEKNLFWESNNWIRGILNSAGDISLLNYTTSYDVIDAIVRKMLNKNHFPNLREITLVGFAGGAQFLQRYSWATSVDVDYAYSNVTFRYIVGNAGSYLYLSGDRPSADCMEARNTGSQLVCASYITPDFDGEEEGCAYDNWKYGLASFVPLESYPYFNKFYSGNSVDDIAVGEQAGVYRTKDVRFVLAGLDVCNCNMEGYENDDVCFVHSSEVACGPSLYGATCCDSYPETSENDFNNDCAAAVQGHNRLQRGLLYISYLKWLWSDDPAYSPVYKVVPTLGDDSSAFHASDIVKYWAYGIRQSKDQKTDNNAIELTDDSSAKFAQTLQFILMLLITFLLSAFAYCMCYGGLDVLSVDRQSRKGYIAMHPMPVSTGSEVGESHDIYVRKAHSMFKL